MKPILFRSRKTVTIDSLEYSRLVRQDYLATKYKELSQDKAIEIKRLQTLLSYHKKQASKRPSALNEDDDEPKSTKNVKIT